MSLIATAAGASASPIVNLLTHGHKKGSHAGGKDGTASSSTQGPATTQSLLSSLFESIQQVIGISVTAPQRAASATVPSAGAVTSAAGAGASAAAMSPTTTPSATAAASAAPGSAQDVQSFLHSLFQALKADGLGASAGGATASAVVGAGPATGIGAGAASGAGRYDGSLVSSLQTLIHQVNSNGPATAATSNLSASFNTLIQGAHGSAAVADTGGSGTVSQASLQNFLSNLLQSVQSSGIHSFSGMGANVNAKV
jgi:hypothetical protein